MHPSARPVCRVVPVNSTLGRTTFVGYLLRVFSLSLAVAVPGSVVFVRSMETSGQFDSIGWWYTLTVATLFATSVAAALAFILWLAKRARRR